MPIPVNSLFTLKAIIDIKYHHKRKKEKNRRKIDKNNFRSVL